MSPTMGRTTPSTGDAAAGPASADAARATARPTSGIARHKNSCAAAIDGEDDDLLRRLEQGEGVAGRARRIPAGVPAEQGDLAWRFCADIRHHENRPPGRERNRLRHARRYSRNLGLVLAQNGEIGI